MTGMAITGAVGAVFIPAQVQMTTTNVTSCVSSNTTGHESQTANCNEDFHVNGNFCTKRFECCQGCLSDNLDWDQSGTKNCSFATEHDTCKACHSDCHNLTPGAGEWLCDSGCGCGDDHESICTDPEEDIDRRIE